MKPSQEEVPAVAAIVDTSSLGPDHTRDDFGWVGVRFWENVDPCSLSDPYVVSSWELSHMSHFREVELFKFCVHPEAEGAPHYAAYDRAKVEGWCGGCVGESAVYRCRMLI